MPDIKKITREKGEEKLKTTPLDPLHKCTVGLSKMCYRLRKRGKDL